MLVSHLHRFIYTKTLKTAGTSVESYFEPYCMGEGAWTPSHYRDEYASEAGIVGYRGMKKPKNCRWWSHMSAAMIREQLGDAVWSEYFKFCVIRNPYEKALSMFYWRKSIGTITVDESDTEQTQFERWLEMAGAPIDRDTYLIDGQFCLDDVIRYETLEKDMERICIRLGIAWNPELLPQFKSGVRPDRGTVEDIYTKKSMQIVFAAYEFELDYFGYSFPAGANAR